MSRALLAVVLLAGCFEPVLLDGLPCSVSRACPDGQFCVGGMEYCTAVEPPQSLFRQISAGAHTCAIDPENELYCWGDNRYGELGQGDTMPRARPTRVGLDDDWQMVAAGEGYTLAIKSDGTLWGWGTSEDLGPDGGLEPVELFMGTDWAFVTAGSGVWAALDGGGVLLIMQDGTERPVPSMPDGWDTIAVSGGHYCGLRGTDLYCWGFNEHGEVGNDNNKTDVPEPVEIDPDREWVSVSAGLTHTCAVDDDRALWCWGENRLGQAGLPDTIDQVQVPTRVDGIGTVNKVVGAWNTTCAVEDELSSGGAWCFGAGGDGQVGDGEADDRSIGPRGVLFTVFFQISAGLDHACGIDFQSRGYCWGDDSTGQLGDGQEGRLFEPSSIESGASFEEVFVGPRHTCAILSDGSAACWGKNGHGQLGDRSELRRRFPSRVVDGVDDDGGWSQISAGFDHTCAIRTTGTLWCWGAAALGQLGIAGGFDLQTPAQVGETSTWSEVAAGDGGTCAIDGESDLWCWGRAWSESPTLVEPADRWSGLTAGLDGEMCALRDDLPMCWMLDSTSPPYEVQSTTRWDLHARGFETSCGIDAQGDMLCIGDDSFGALGNGLPPDPTTTTLVAPTIAGGWTAVAAGKWITCGLRGTDLYCWGWNIFGQVGDGTGDTRFEPEQVGIERPWQSISISDRSVCAVSVDGRNVYCWGISHGPAGGWDAPTAVITP